MSKTKGQKMFEGQKCYIFEKYGQEGNFACAFDKPVKVCFELDVREFVIFFSEEELKKYKLKDTDDIFTIATKLKIDIRQGSIIKEKLALLREIAAKTHKRVLDGDDESDVQRSTTTEDESRRKYILLLDEDDDDYFMETYDYCSENYYIATPLNNVLEECEINSYEEATITSTGGIRDFYFSSIAVTKGGDKFEIMEEITDEHFMRVSVRKIDQQDNAK